MLEFANEQSEAGLSTLAQETRRCLESASREEIDQRALARETLICSSSFCCFLVHMTGGQPARDTEITTARYQNGFLQDRDIPVMDGQVVFVSHHHKTQSLWDKP